MAGRHMSMNANTLMRDPAWNEGRRPAPWPCTRTSGRRWVADGQMVRVITEAGARDRARGDRRNEEDRLSFPMGSAWCTTARHGVNVNRLTKNTHRDHFRHAPAPVRALPGGGGMTMEREGDMKIGTYAYEEFIEKVKEFHGSIAPGIVAGGIMVDIAKANLPEGEFFDVICESAHCLPDAVQLLTPCTIGNRWLKIADTSRYALTFYNKYTGKGIRVYLDAAKLGDRPAIKAWFLKEKPKKEQDLEELLREFKLAGTSIYSTESVTVKPAYITVQEKKHSAIRLCPECKEAFRTSLGEQCPACRGRGPYS